MNLNGMWQGDALTIGALPQNACTTNDASAQTKKCPKAHAMPNDALEVPILRPMRACIDHNTPQSSAQFQGVHEHWTLLPSTTRISSTIASCIATWDDHCSLCPTCRVQIWAESSLQSQASGLPFAWFYHPFLVLCHPSGSALSYRGRHYARSASSWR